MLSHGQVTLIAIVASVAGGLLLVILASAVFHKVGSFIKRKSPISMFFSDDPLLDAACKPSDEDIEAVQEAAKEAKAKDDTSEAYFREVHVEMSDVWVHR
jgi:hypothetical protein